MKQKKNHCTPKSPRNSRKYQVHFAKNWEKDTLSQELRSFILEDKLPVIQLTFQKHYLNEKYQSVRYPSKNSSNFLPGC